MYWGMAGIVGTRGPEGCRWHNVAFGDSKGMLGAVRGCQGIRGVRGLLWGWLGVLIIRARRA